MLMDREDTCHRTCFSLHLDGNMLDHFSELRSVEGLQEGSVLRVVEGLSGNWAAYKGGHMEAGQGSTLLTLAGHRQACGGSGGGIKLVEAVWEHSLLLRLSPAHPSTSWFKYQIPD